jgi:class 3 adenylate cyclase
MRSFLRTYVQRFMAVSPGAVVVAIAFFGQVLEKDESLRIPVMFSTNGALDDVAAATALADSDWEIRPSVAPNTPSTTPQTRWLRVEIAADQTPRDQIAEIKFQFFNEIEYFLVEHGKVIDHFLTGVAHPASFTKFPGLYFHFPFSSGTTQRFLYVKTVGYGTTIARIHVYDAPTFAAINEQRDGIMGLLFGCSIMIIFFNFAMFLTLRSRSYIFEIGVQLALLTVVYFLEGYYKRLTPGINWDYSLWFKLTIVAYLISLSLIVGFFRDTLQLDQNFPDFRRGYNSLLGMYLAAILITLLGSFAIGLLAAVVVSWTGWVWLLARHSRFAHLKSIFVTFLGQSGGITALIVTTTTVFDLLSDSMLNKALAHIGIIWMGVTNLIGIGIRLRLSEERSGKIKQALTGTQYRTELNRLLTSSYVQIENLSRVEATIMFVDIVSFSLVAAGRSATDIFTALSNRLREIVTIIEQNGGLVDRSLGDGVLCYFTSNNGVSSKHHALAAFEAASEIQRETVRAAVATSSRLVMPVRIGIHSAEVLIGNLGDERHLDFTMIGSGVNFTSRLESAASPFKMNLSETTVEHLVGLGLDAKEFLPISLSIKHQSTLKNAFEFNPLSAAQPDLRKAETQFLEQMGMSRVDQRRVVKSLAYIKLTNDSVEFNIADFSLHGFKAISPKMFGRRTILAVSITTSSVDVNEQLDRQLMRHIMVELRWSRQDNHGTFHGLRILGGSMAQRQFLFDQFSQHLGIDDTERAKMESDDNTADIRIIAS